MSLQTIIQQIKNATLPGENTALRVGSAFEQMDAVKRDITDSLSKSETVDMINAVKLLAATGTPFLGTIDPATVIPAGNFWAFAGEGTYPNAGGIVVGAGEIAIITRVDTTFDSVILDVPVKSIEDIEKTSTIGLVDTYTITYTDGSTPTTFEVTNGETVTEWEAKAYPENSLVVKNNIMYKVINGENVDSSQTPENSPYWIEQGNDKALKVVGKNKVNPNYIKRGFWINTTGHEFTPNNSYRVTEFIPVYGDMVANHSIVGSGLANLVYDENMLYLRKFDTQQYTYQAGDAYVTWSYQNAWEDFQVEEGTVSTEFQAFTDKEDVMSLIRPQTLEMDIYAAELVIPLDSGAIGRRLGFDIPSDQVGNNSYIQAKPFATALQGSYKVSVICNHINHSSFLALDPETVITSIGAGVTKFEKTFTNQILNVIIFPNNLTSGSDRYFRISQIHILPLNAESRDNLAKVIVTPEYMKRVDISSGFNATTQGWGVTRFANLVTAWKADDVDYLQGRRNRKTLFTSMPGIDNYWETEWAGNDAEDPNDGAAQGIIPRNHQYFDTFDLDNPDLTEWIWNGHAGYSNGFVMSTTQAMKKSTFHISEAGAKSRIRGAKITSSNTRYCVHPESAGTGNKAEWLLENLILNWGGRPNTISPGGTHLGIGISSGETGHVKNVKFIGVAGGIGGHNNGWGTNQGAKPFICPAAKLTIENCDLNSNDIEMQTYSNDADVPDSLIIKDCGDVDTLSLGFTPPATVQNWKVHIINSDIANDLS